MVAQAQSTAGSVIGEWPEPGQVEVDKNPVVKVAVGTLSTAGSPRMSGEDPGHVQALAEVAEELPPIIVHRPTMRVIDGVHRLRVAKQRGQDEIAARFFDGNDADAFVLAVRSNVAHGLPLPLADRKIAAERIIASHPQWSDRMIASSTGLAARTVAEMRKRSAGVEQLGVRIGQDGRVRPLNGAQGRLLASEIMADNPGLSLRQVARAAHISPETARDIRNRLRRGEDPVARRRRHPAADETVPRESRRSILAPSLGVAGGQGENRAAVIERLKADPALRFTETGRTLLRLLHIHMLGVEEWRRISESVPSHCSGAVADLGRECAQLWEVFAEQVERKVADIA